MSLPFAPDADPFTSATTAAGSSASGASPQTYAGLTLPANGIWIVAAYARIQGAQQHMMSATWIVAYCDASSNDTVLTTAIGVVSKSPGSTFGLSDLTCSNPASDGQLTFTASWTDGSNHTVGWSTSARKLLAL